MSEEDDMLIPVTLIKEYHVCPRIVYFREVAKAQERATENMLDGREKHEHISEIEKRRKTVLAERKEEILQRWDGIKVASERLGIFGTVDCVIRTRTGYHLIEHKSGSVPNKPKQNHIYQAAAYAMLAEEALGIIMKDVIIDYASGKKSFVILMTEEIRNHIAWTVKQIRKIIHEEYLPSFRLKKYCAVCGYRWICMNA